MKSAIKLLFFSELVRIHIVFFIFGLIFSQVYPEYFRFYLLPCLIFSTIFGILMITIQKILKIKYNILNSIIENFSSFDVMMGGVEDFIFVFPLLLLSNPFLICFFGIISMILFSLMHMQYSVKMRILVCLYIPLAYFFSKEYGILTTVVGHSLYNYFIYLFHKYRYLRDSESYRSQISEYLTKIAKINNNQKK